MPLIARTNKLLSVLILFDLCTALGTSVSPFLLEILSSLCSCHGAAWLFSNCLSLPGSCSQSSLQFPKTSLLPGLASVPQCPYPLSFPGIWFKGGGVNNLNKSLLQGTILGIALGEKRKLPSRLPSPPCGFLRAPSPLLSLWPVYIHSPQLTFSSRLCRLYLLLRFSPFLVIGNQPWIFLEILRQAFFYHF